MTFRIIKGDLFDPTHNFHALAQGVNCRGIMGAGIAVPFKQKYPDMFTEYKALCDRLPNLLPGTAQVSMGDGTRLSVINLFSQFYPGANAEMEYLEGALFSMDAQLNLLTHVYHRLEDQGLTASFTNVRVGLPLIGGGIGGLQRHNIINSMEIILGPSQQEYTLVERD